ncbi:MAG: hypothetical protein ACRC8K_22305, partial [Waterburya sp.]
NKAELVAGNIKRLDLEDFDFVPNRIKTIVFNAIGSSFGTNISLRTNAPSGFQLYSLVTRKFTVPPAPFDLPVPQDGVYDFFPNDDLTSIMVVPRAQGVLGDSFQRQAGGSDLTINYNSTTYQDFACSVTNAYGSQTGMFAGFNAGSIATLFDGRILLGACIPFTMATNNGGLQCFFHTNGSSLSGSSSFANVENTAQSSRGVLNSYFIAPCYKNQLFQLQIAREAGNTVTAAANVLLGARFFAIRIG